VTVDSTKAAKSALWSLVENGGLALISMATLVIYTHWLSTAEFGLFAVVLALVEVLQVFVTMLFHDALVQREGVTESHFDTAFTFSVVLSLALMAGCWLGAPLFASAVGAPGAAPVLRAMSLCFPAAAVSSTIVARQRRELLFRPLALRSLVGRFAGALVGVALILAGAGVWGLIAQQVLIQLVGSLILWLACEKRPRLRLGRAELRELGGFGLYSLASLFVVFGVKRIFAIAAGIFLGVEIAGYLNLSFRAIDVFWSIAATAATQVALPLLASMQSDMPRLRRAFQLATSMVCVVLYACFIGLGLVAPEVVRLLFGEKWLPAAPYVTALAFLVLLQAPRVLVAPLLTALGRPRDLLLSKSAELVFVLLALGISRVPSLSWALGIWIAREVVSLPLTISLLRRATGFGAVEQFRGAFVPLCCAVIMGAVVWPLSAALPSDWSSWLRLLVLVPVGALAFVGSCRLLNREIVQSLTAIFTTALRRQAPVVEAPALALGRTP
jgi:O-antigen/teichoic acid export membrane protein